MISNWTLLLISGAYVGLLFAIAICGERHPLSNRHRHLQPAIYALALAVYCSSWTFYGAVGTAARSDLGFLPIYLGPILMLLFGWKLMERVVRISQKQRIVSIADFLSSRYGRMPGLAALVTLLALVATIPYLSLQYKAVAMSVEVLAALPERPGMLADPALHVALILALFAILFGTRRTDATEHHRGLILAVATESLVKLMAFITLAAFATWHLPGTGNVPARIVQATQTVVTQAWPGSMVAQTLIAALAILCLPRQFQVAVVECQDVTDMRPARWLFGGYLLLFSLLVLPIGLASTALFTGKNIAPDSYVLALPIHFDNEILALITYLGGFSAATGMAIMASITLATMISNDLVMPVLLRLRGHHAARIAINREVRWVRRIAILILAILGFAYHRAVQGYGNLAEYGLLAFAAVAQFAPALIGGLIWRGASRHGALAGTLTGAIIWTYTLFLPTLVHSGWLDWQTWLEAGAFGIHWLRPEQLFALTGWDNLTHGVFWSLLANTGVFLLVSMRWRPRLREYLLAASFLNPDDRHESVSSSSWTGNLLGSDLLALAERIVGERAARRAFADHHHNQSRNWEPEARADRALMQFTERLMASAIGADSARLTLTSALRGAGLELGEVVNLLDHAGQEMRFNREILTTTLENLSQAVSVVDAELRLVTWNRRYQALFNYPESLLCVGRPIADLIRWNAEHGEMGEGDTDTLIQRRIAHLAAGTAYAFERVRANGQVLEIRGQPLPGGGYVTTFSDITAYKQAEHALREANETLEQRVELRTREAEAAQQSKSRFLAAVGHDLLQPLNAARLFASALRESQDMSEQQRLAERVDASLRAAEDLLDGLLDISRLDANELKPDVQPLDAGELLQELANQYAPLAHKRGLSLRVFSAEKLFILSDRRLLRRALQNFIANAMRYTRSGGVLLAARKRGGDIVLQVWDSGAGIHEHHMQQIFEEFRRFAQPGQGERGLGLGLSICQRIARTLNHQLEVRSRIGHGSLFAIHVPRAQQQPAQPAAPILPSQSGLAGLKVLSIDNDPDILDGMRTLLERWQVDVVTATCVDDALAAQGTHQPDVLLVDYHLHERMDGLALIARLREAAGWPLPAVLLTGDGSEQVKLGAREHNVTLLTKPVKPASLRAFLAAQHG